MDVDGEHSLVFVVFNTLFVLPTQEDQVRCVRNASAHLRPGGCFVVEAFVPDVSRFDRGQRAHVNRIELDSVMLEVSTHDAAAQRVVSQHVVIFERDVRLYPGQIRYTWPSELDLMARLAGLRLRERWSGWKREPFDADSSMHVSIYEKPAA